MPEMCRNMMLVTIPAYVLQLGSFDYWGTETPFQSKTGEYESEAYEALDLEGILWCMEPEEAASPAKA